MTPERIIRWASPPATFPVRMHWRALLAAAEARVMAAALIGAK